MNNEVKTHEKPEFNGVRHNAIWFGLPAMIALNIYCLVFTSSRQDLSGLFSYTLVAAAFTFFFILCILFKEIKFKEHSGAGWFYAAAEGITYLTCFIYIINLFLNIFTSFEFSNLLLIIIIGVFYTCININDIINTVVTSKKCRLARIQYNKEFNS